MEKLLEMLIKNKIEYYENLDVSLLSTIKLGSVIKLAIMPRNKKELVKILTFIHGLRLRFKVVGNLSNVLFVRNVDYPVIVTNKMVDEISIKNELVEVSAGMLLPKFCEILRKNSLSGTEGLIGIPATIGGAIMCNAGAFGQAISDRLLEIEAFYQGKIIRLKRNEIKFFYHGSNLDGFIVLSAVFLFEKRNEYDIMNLSNEYSFRRSKTQPSGLSLGSVYSQVNGKSAGFYIERAGLKGLRVGGVVISTKHSNFFINDKGGTVVDFLRLSAIVESSVEKQFGISLTPEIEKVGELYGVNRRLSCSFKI